MLGVVRFKKLPVTSMVNWFTIEVNQFGSAIKDDRQTSDRVTVWKRHIIPSLTHSVTMTFIDATKQPVGFIIFSRIL